MNKFFSYAPAEDNVYKNYKIYVVIAFLSLLCSLYGSGTLRELLGYINAAVDSVDSNVFFTVARMMREKGATPYLDAFDHKGPIIYLIDYVALCLGGNRMIVILEFFNYCLSLFLIHRCIREFTSPCVRIASLAIFASFVKRWIAGGNLTEEFALYFSQNLTIGP